MFGRKQKKRLEYHAQLFFVYQVFSIRMASIGSSARSFLSA